TVTPMPTSATAASGVASKTVTGVKAGSITIQATSSGLTSDSTTFWVAPGALGRPHDFTKVTYAHRIQPKLLKVAVADASGNVVTSSSASAHSLHDALPIWTVTPMPTSATAASGVASKTVTGVKAGSITIQATSSGLTSDSTTFWVAPG